MYNNKVNLGETDVGNPGYGCHKKSEGCQYCFIRCLDSFRVSNYADKILDYIPDYTILITSLSTDFFLEEADSYRDAAGENIKNHPTLIFVLITKRPERIKDHLPKDGGEGYENVVFDITIENQKRADERLPILLNLPCKHKGATCSPMLEEINIDRFLSTGQIEHVECAGEKNSPRELEETWLIKLSTSCINYKVRFSLMHLGHHFNRISGETYTDHTECYHSRMADKLNLSHYEPLIFNINNQKIIK